MVNDPISDMLTRIRNAIMAEKKEVVVPLSKAKLEILKILKNEGFISSYRVEKGVFPPTVQVELRYKEKNKSVIQGMKRISKPGRRVYVGSENLPRILDGLGIAVISTSQGIMTGRECKKRNIGGEVLLGIW